MRSQMTRVESTFDREKRQAFKARLAERIVEREVEEETPLPSPHPLLNKSVNHPDLGVCEVLSIDEDTNSLVLKHPHLGLLDLVLSQTISRLSLAVEGRSYISVSDGLSNRVEPFSPTNWARPDQPIAFRERDPDFERMPPWTVPHIPVGALVWHPDFGACTVLSVDSLNNSIILDFPFGKLDMVLSQVESKLRPVTAAAPLHAGKSPTDPQTQPAPVQQTLFGSKEISLSLSRAFPGWKSQDQYLHLTHIKHLTTEQANELVASIRSGSPSNYIFHITWEPAPTPDSTPECT